MQLLNDELVVLKFRVHLQDTLFDEIKSVGSVLLGEYDRVFFKGLWLQAEHEIIQDFIVVFGQVFDSFDHTKNELDLFVAVVLDRIGFQALFILRELRNDLSETGLEDSSKRIVV